MAPQAVLILLAVSLPILSSRHVFLNSPLHWISPATLFFLSVLFDTGHETTALRLSFVLPSFHVWLCLYLLQIQGQEFLIVFVLVFYISI